VPQNEGLAPHTRRSPGKSKKRFYNLASSSIACCLQRKLYLRSGMKTLRIIGLAMALFGALTLQSCKKDPCKNVTCQNGGTCQDGNCRCSLPWEGSKCEVDARDKFVGAWQGTENCGTPRTYTTTINRSQASPVRITIYERDFQITYYAELNSSTSFTIPQQTYTEQGQAVGISGNGTLNGNTLIMSVTYNLGSGGFTCSYTLTRQ